MIKNLDGIKGWMTNFRNKWKLDESLQLVK